MSSMQAPKVTLALPVYNGERYLVESIQSMLRQTYDNFEILVSDNASTDRTRQICLEFAARDPRILYHRQDRNIGAGPNHDWCARQATGKYFKWGSDDDLLEPQYLEKCVAMLESDQEAVLCHSKTRILRDDGHETFAVHLAGLDSPSAAERLAAVILKPHWAVEGLGVFRTSALAKTNLQGGYYGKDKALMAEMALLGRFLHVPEPLFINRDHANRSMRAVPFHHRQRWHDTSSTRPVITQWALYTDYCRAVDRHVTDRAEKLRCYGMLVRWWFENKHTARLALDVAMAYVPGLAAAMYRVRDWYIRRGIGAVDGGPTRD